MRHTLGVALFCATTALGLAMIAVYSSCGSTGGGTDPADATAQFVSQSCTPLGQNGGGNCLTLSAPNSVKADGATISGFRATLVDGSGRPLSNVQICFGFEDPGVAKITEPTDGCGLTDANGNVSGQFQSGAQDGSFQLIADSPPGFGLEARKTISFEKTIRGVPPGLPCSTSSDCTSGECSGNTAVCPDGPCCLAGPGDPCTVTPSNCSSGLVCLSGGTCGVPPTPAPLANGSSCTTSSLCLSTCCASSPPSSAGSCASPVSCVLPACACI